MVNKDGSKFWSSQTWQHILTQTKHFAFKCIYFLALRDEKIREQRRLVLKTGLVKLGSTFCRAKTPGKMVFCYQNCSHLLWEKKCSRDQEELLKFEAEGLECAKILRSLEQFIQTVKGQNNIW